MKKIYEFMALLGGLTVAGAMIFAAMWPLWVSVAALVYIFN